MKNLRWQILIAILALAAVVLLLLNQTQVGETLSQVIEPATAGGVYVEGLVGKPIRFNPLLDDFNQVDQDVDRLVFSRMIRFDSWGNPQPELAESFGVSVIGDIFNIELRENAVWHDGEAVTTQDVLFTIELMRNGEMPVSDDVRALWNTVEVIAFDALNLQFRLAEPYAPFMDYLSFGILPRHLLEGKSPQEIINDPFNLLPIGSGPYKVVDLQSVDGQVTSVVLEAFEDYYMGAPLIEQVVFQYFDTTEDALDAYRQGEILGIGSVSPDVLDSVLAEKNLNIHSVRIPEMTMVLLNLGESGPTYFQDVAVRKALMTALNRNWMIDQVMDGQAIMAHTPIMLGSWAYFPEVEKYEYNPEDAVKLLRANGYGLASENSLVREKDGESLSFDLIYPDDERYSQLAEMIREYWSEIGVQANLLPVQPDVMVREYLVPRNYQAALVDLSLYDSPDPDPYPFWHQAMITNGQNYSQWDDRRASEYLERARVTPDHFERSRLYRNFQIHFTRELPALPLFFEVFNYPIDQQVRGVQLGSLYNPADRFDNIYLWSLETGPQIEEAPEVSGEE
ncbi:MAG TPA: peptide ABC transporter substrate-binding protein [Anaerolineales bacterium]|jgi:peptide/nickel transport system substrate-binding protein|nr:peptide ABC transporter substrate-binding protein [Anaerolineales bacterium]